ncbi:nicotinate-nucleotide adenylyltransferase [Stenotrophomonas humi]|uniref:Probable nicotinate-nucleotide adenylyltransferase n=1 Tax=Stenotrophomonas humi TaxID=405444 RepID=A0A0R0CFW9_9GAMM|nr:nicotinate-nucleotide adenylyltransferase [Stenotrophomonas humi]KRG65210.1 nicotinate-nucleotide adenylyltransferase [Stenotrophomonas humi]
MLMFYGGTFDPVHNGHLAIARCAAQELQVPVRLMPAADPPHRAVPGADARQRAHMLALAAADEPDFSVDLRELRRAELRPGVPSWTMDTLRDIRAEFGMSRPVALLMGADSLLGLTTWHEWEHLLELAHIVVAERPGSALDGTLPPVLAAHLRDAWAPSISVLSRAAGRVWRLRQPLQTESATAVRNMIASGGQWQSLVPAKVADYIQAQGLYGCHAVS